MSEQLNLNNFLNVAGFALSWVLNSDVMRGPGGQDEGGNMFLRGIGQLFETFESIVMPTSQTFLIAHLILILEGAFAITQLLPKYRGSVMVQESVKHYFFLSALMQFLWSVDIGIQNLWAAAVSVIFMLSMFVSITKVRILLMNWYSYSYVPVYHRYLSVTYQPRHSLLTRIVVHLQFIVTIDPHFPSCQHWFISDTWGVLALAIPFLHALCMGLGHPWSVNFDDLIKVLLCYRTFRVSLHNVPRVRPVARVFDAAADMFRRQPPRRQHRIVCFRRQPLAANLLV